MTGFVKRVRQKLAPSCIVKGRLRKEGCQVRMTGAPDPRLIVDFDKPGAPLSSSTVRCDYLLIAEGADGFGRVVLLELKRGRLHAGQVVRQLQQGASAAEDFISRDERVKFFPVAASGSASKHDRNALRKKTSKVRFHGHAEAVRRISCRENLADVLRS